MEGARGSFNVNLLFACPASVKCPRAEGTQTWNADTRCHSAGCTPPRRTGQYPRVIGGGRITNYGGHADAWHTRLTGLLTRPNAGRQQVVILIKGTPTGVFVLTPLQPGALKRDSGTQRSVGYG